MKFGEFVREKRLKAEMGLREFCKTLQTDPSNWSKVERGVLPAPNDREFLEKVAKILKLKKGDKDWFAFFDLADLSQQKIPDDVFDDEKVVSALPVFFHTIRGGKPTKEEFNKLITLIKQR
jgi:transcriptional regulator with XRE-family HTH domain